MFPRSTPKAEEEEEEEEHVGLTPNIYCQKRMKRPTLMNKLVEWVVSRLDGDGCNGGEEIIKSKLRKWSRRMEFNHLHSIKKTTKTSYVKEPRLNSTPLNSSF